MVPQCYRWGLSTNEVRKQIGIRGNASDNACTLRFACINKYCRRSLANLSETIDWALLLLSDYRAAARERTTQLYAIRENGLIPCSNSLPNSPVTNEVELYLLLICSLAVMQ